MAQWPPEPVVEALSTGVSCDLGRQAGQQPTQGLRPMTFQGEEIFELVYDSLYDLSLSRGQRRAALGHALRSLFLGVAATNTP